MSSATPPQTNGAPRGAQAEPYYQRFARSQRWEHLLLIASFTVLLLTGLPQKYRAAGWSQLILSTPERVTQVRAIHHVAAVVLILESIYHLAVGLRLLARRQLTPGMFVVGQDLRDARQMLKYLLFLGNKKPAFGKYNFEQKITYWFLFFGIGILIVTGVVLWFPIFFTRFLPGDMIPAAKLAHGTEAVVAGIFVLIWHFYHVHIERLNMSIFTGHIIQSDLKEYHGREYARLVGKASKSTDQGKNE
jgi:formate dehydrogenase gamma subunit